MKRCKYCDAKIKDSAKFCDNCGGRFLDESDLKQEEEKQEQEVKIQETAQQNTNTNSNSMNETFGLLAKIFMILDCVFLGFYIIPLCWTIPMTVALFRKIENKEPISTAFKVCTLLFVSLFAGVFLFCMSDEQNKNN